jgi:uncharacterized protein (DUF305 family)
MKGHAMKFNRILAASLIPVVFLSACGGSSAADVVGDVVEDVASTVQFNDADVMFAQMMIPHHEQAIEMSDIALDPTVGASDAVKALATSIKAAQDPEIATMTSFLSLWKQSLTVDESVDHSDMMSGMLTLDEISNLSTLRGIEFDRAWMLGMIAHHEGAIEMAKDVIPDGTNAAVRTLANAIVAAQDSEIAEMEKLLS